MKYKNQKRICSLLCMVLAFTTLFFFCIEGGGLVKLSAAASDSSDAMIQKLEDSLAKAVEDKKAAEAALAQAKNDKIGAIEQKNALDQKLDSLIAVRDINEKLIESYNKKINDLDVRIEETETALEYKRSQIVQRLVYLYEDEEISYLEMLLTSTGMNEFLTKLERIRNIMAHDDLILAEYEQTKIMLAESKDSVYLLKEKAENKLTELETQEAELDAALKESQTFINELEKDVSVAQKLYEEAIAAEEEFNAQLEARLAELLKKTNSEYVGGEFMWPLTKSYTRISSYFGNRIHPVTGKPQFHLGVDIPAPYGTEIYAVNTGTVLEVAYHQSNGNYVIIDHGGGIASFYSHLSKFNVSVGDYVSRGEVIGYVGMTGWATGNHLHLSMYENNTAVNPLPYFNLDE